ncbi:hypothetical protein EV361DRAFT_110027 [Lentinula raphanica]|nr:hypothetical protein EV361DRAFT_110027 [Lentinula raphanica]
MDDKRQSDGLRVRVFSRTEYPLRRTRKLSPLPRLSGGTLYIDLHLSYGRTRHLRSKGRTVTLSLCSLHTWRTHNVRTSVSYLKFTLKKRRIVISGLTMAWVPRASRLNPALQHRNGKWSSLGTPPPLPLSQITRRTHGIWYRSTKHEQHLMVLVSREPFSLLRSKHDACMWSPGSKENERGMALTALYFMQTLARRLSLSQEISRTSSCVPPSSSSLTPHRRTFFHSPIKCGDLAECHDIHCVPLALVQL